MLKISLKPLKKFSNFINQTVSQALFIPKYTIIVYLLVKSKFMKLKTILVFRDILF